MFTLDGVPMLYNGMEVGDTTESGAPALFERLPVFWEIVERRPEFPRFYRQMIALRGAHAALRQGELEWLRNSDETRVLTYARRNGGEEFLVALNFSNRPFAGIVEASGAGFAEVTPRVGGEGQAEARRAVGLPALALDAWEFRIFRRTAG